MENKIDLVEQTFKDIDSLSKNTHERYKRDSARFREYVVGTGADFHEVVKSREIIRTLVDYKNKLKADGLRVSSITSIFTSLKYFFALLLELDVIQEDRVKDSKYLKLRAAPEESRSGELVLDDAKFEALRGYLRKRGSLLSRTIFSILYSSGARAHEIVAIKVSNINLELGEIYLEVTKGNKPRLIRVNTETAEVLREYVTRNKLSQADYLFPHNSCSWLYKQVQKLSKSAKVNFSSHSFRWRYANRLGKVMKREYLAYLMGHGKKLSILYRSKDVDAFWGEVSNAYDKHRLALI
ncbi:MAG: tyrosine-type recombinase/integrase [Candidatus Omnitrophota bacterium]